MIHNIAGLNAGNGHSWSFRDFVFISKDEKKNLKLHFTLDDDGWDDVEIDVRHTKRRNVIHLTWKAKFPSLVSFIWKLYVSFEYLSNEENPTKTNILMWWRSCRWWRYCRDQDGSHALRKHEQLKCRYLFNVFSGLLSCLFSELMRRSLTMRVVVLTLLH